MGAFEFDGKKYREAATPQREWGARIIDSLELRGDEAVLDLGCGDGTVSKYLAGRVPRGRVLGIDSSRGMIDAACELEGGNLAFELNNISEMDYMGRFDVIFSNATLHWIKDHRNLLCRCRQALVPGGSLCFNFAGNGNCRFFFDAVRRVMEEPDYRDIYNRFEWPWFMPGLEEYRALVDESGFREAAVWEENADRYFADSAEITAWIDQPSIVPFLALLNGALKKSFRDRVVALVLSTTLQPDGRCFETFRRINVRAKK